ncbi:MAG: hypothetical protein R3E89_10885 [Thiolinea sp.]
MPGRQIRKNLCFRSQLGILLEKRKNRSLVLSQVNYQAPGQPQRLVLGEASLSQIEASFDDGATDPMFVSTRIGLGGDRLQTLNSRDCAGGELHSENGRPVLCARTHNAGYLYKVHGTASDRGLCNPAPIPRSAHAIIRYAGKFYENGTMEPAVGLSGIPCLRSVKVKPFMAGG